MKKLTFLLTAAMLASGLAACSDNSNDTTSIIEAKDMPTINMVSTHAIDLGISVSQLTFVPNSAAAWLGRIILLDDAGHLYSTDIEGRDPKPVGTGKYIDIFGLTREAAPGVFLAITENNKIEAFIESDDIGNFSPMIYSGERFSPKAFCIATIPTDKGVRILTSSQTINEISLTIVNKVIEQQIVSSKVTKAQSSNCFDNPYAKNTVYINASLDNKFLISPTKLSKLTALNLNSKVGSSIEVYSESDRYHISITNGLSVRGVDRIKYVSTTQSNYGGGAYANGVLALVDSDDDRIVFISMSYAKRQLLKAVNPPADVRE